MPAPPHDGFGWNTDCPACTEAFDAATNPPGLAPCFHPLCQRCINKAATAPTVTRQCLWLVEGVYCAAPFTAGQLLAGNLAADAATARLCPHCDEPATHYCAVCNIDMCSIEAMSHQRAKATKAHDVAALAATVVAGSGQPMCATHLASLATLFCDQCDAAACPQCLDHPHKGHIFVPLTDGLAKRRDKLCQLAVTLQPKRELYSTTVEHLNARIERLERHMDDTCRHIQQTFAALCEPHQHILEALKSRQQALDQQAATAINADIKALKAQRDTFLIARDHIVRAQEAHEQLTEGAAHFTLRLVARIEALHAADVPTEPIIQMSSAFTPPPPLEPADVLNSDVGSLGAIVAMPLPTPPSGAATQGLPLRRHTQIRDFHAFHQPVRAIGVSGNGHVQFASPWGLCLDSNGNLVAGEYGNQRVQIVTQQGEHVRTLPMSAAVADVCLAPSGSLWVALGMTKVVLVNAISGVVERSIDCLGATGLCALADGALIASCWDQKTVIYFNADGSQRWSAKGAGFTLAAGVAVIPESDLLAVSDANNGRIQLLSLRDGTLCGVVHGADLPRGLLYHHDAQALVVGESSSISAWSVETGVCIHRWAVGTVKSVYGLALTPDGSALFATDKGGNRLVVF